MERYLSIRRTLAEIGTAIVPISIPLGMMAKVLMGSVNPLGNILMALGILIMTPYHRIKHGLHPGILSGVILFILASYVYYFCSEFDDSMHLVYLGVVLAYSLSLSLSAGEEDIRVTKVIYYIFLFSFLCVVLALFGFITGKINIFETFVFSGEDTLYDGLTMGYVATIQMASSFYFIFETKEKRNRLLYILAIIIDIVILVMAFKRTPILVGLFILLFYLYKTGNLRLTYKSVVISTCIIFLIVFFVLRSQELSYAFEILFGNIWDGISGLLFGEHTGHGLTNSTDIRIETRDQAFALIRDFDILNVCIGSGYMTFYFDMPLIQSYLDMGIIGFAFYAYYTVYLPLRTCLFSYDKNKTVIFFAMMCMYSTMCCMTSGHPYAHTTWFPIILLCYALNRKSRESDARLLKRTM